MYTLLLAGILIGVLRNAACPNQNKMGNLISPYLVKILLCSERYGLFTPWRAADYFHTRVYNVISALQNR